MAGNWQLHVLANHLDLTVTHHFLQNVTESPHRFLSNDSLTGLELASKKTGGKQQSSPYSTGAVQVRLQRWAATSLAWDRPDWAMGQLNAHFWPWSQHSCTASNTSLCKGILTPFYINFIAMVYPRRHLNIKHILLCYKLSKCTMLTQGWGR